MTKKLIAWVFACLSALSSAQEVIHVHIAYPEQSGPQGDYLLVSDNEERFSLDPISPEQPIPAAKIDGIIPSLEKEYPFLAGKITVSRLDAKIADLVKTGEVLIFGQIKNPGNHPADTLGSCISKATPTEFASLRRIQVIHGGKSAVYNMTQKTHSEIKLPPGAIVFVPTKKIIGL